MFQQPLHPFAPNPTSFGVWTTGVMEPVDSFRDIIVRMYKNFTATTLEMTSDRSEIELLQIQYVLTQLADDAATSLWRSLVFVRSSSFSSASEQKFMLTTNGVNTHFKEYHDVLAETRRWVGCTYPITFLLD